MKVHLSMPNDGQSNIFLRNGLHEFAREHALEIDFSFSDHRNHSIERTVDFINTIKPDVCLILYLNELEHFIDWIECPIKCGWIFDVTFGGVEVPVSSLRPGLDKLDYFFTISPDHAKAFPKGYWVPEGCDPWSHYPIKTNNYYGCTFVGQIVEDSQWYKQRGFVHLDRADWLKYLVEKFDDLIKIYGKIYGTVDLKGRHVGESITGNWGNNVVSANSIINLGHSGWPNIKYSWSARDYRIMAAGGFLITNRIKGHTDFFQDGRNIILYSSNEECADKIEFYRDKPDLRKKIADRGMNTVLSSFTFKHSFEKIFKHMELT
jgi:hypothetical protein